MDTQRQVSIFMIVITFLCLLNLAATGYLIKVSLNKSADPKNEHQPASKEYEELDKKLDKFFEKQDQEMKKLFEEK